MGRYLKICSRKIRPGCSSKAQSKVRLAHTLDKRVWWCRVASKQRFNVIGARYVLVTVTIRPLAGDDKADFTRPGRADGPGSGACTHHAASIELPCAAKKVQATHARRRTEHNVFASQVSCSESGRRISIVESRDGRSTCQSTDRYGVSELCVVVFDRVRVHDGIDRQCTLIQRHGRRRERPQDVDDNNSVCGRWPAIKSVQKQARKSHIRYFIEKSEAFSGFDTARLARTGDKFSRVCNACSQCSHRPAFPRPGEWVRV